MPKCFNDTEVSSDAPLPKIGAAKYFEHPSTSTMLVTYILDPMLGVELWDRTEDKSVPQQLIDAANNPSFLFWAFNAGFDRLAFENAGIIIPLERWRCLMVASLALGVPGGLDDVLERFDIPHRKERDGKRLIRKFCMPQPKNRKVRKWDKHNAPEDWAKFVQYARTDTRVLEPLYKKFADYGKMVNWSDWHMDQRINARGLPIDVKLVSSAITMAEEEKSEILKRMVEVSGLDNPNSKPQVKVWLRDEQNVHLANMQKATVALALTSPSLSDEAREMLMLNQSISKTSTSIWDALDRAVCLDHRLRGAHQYIGAARTGRDAHRLFQPGNLPRGTLADAPTAAEWLLERPRVEVELVYGEVMEVLSSTVRCAITAPEGESLVVADLAGIEGRTLPWQCGFEKKLEQIRSGLDMYIVTASDILGIPYDQITKAQRFSPGKIGELALNYQGAVGAMNTMGAGYGVQYSDAEALPIVKGWRKKNQPIVKYWYACDEAVKLAVRDPGSTHTVHLVSFVVVGDFLMIALPSGRKLAYLHPEYSTDKFTYMGLNGYTHKWERVHSYGGKIVENINQAIARDIFFHGMNLYEEMGGKVVLRVHDELVSSVPSEEAEVWEARLIKCMETVPDWAEGLPLAAEGFITKRYKK